MAIIYTNEFFVEIKSQTKLSIIMDIAEGNDLWTKFVFRDETDQVDPAKLPTSLLALVEWLVYVQVNAIKQLSFSTSQVLNDSYMCLE